jgi:hypothetical protein
MVILSRQYPCEICSRQVDLRVDRSIGLPMKMEKPSTSLATSNGSRPSTTFPPSLR